MSNQKVLKSQVLIRDATSTDISFLFNSWLKSYKASAFAKHITGPVYFDLHHKVIEKLLTRCKVRIACNPTDNNQIYSYAVYEVRDSVCVLHYAYTKEPFRQMGMLGLLLDDAKLPETFFYTHSTTSCGAVLAKLKSKGVYNPYLAFVEFTA
jgi:hypothetical protein